MKIEHEIQETLLGHVEEIASALGRSQSLIYAWGNPVDKAALPVLALPTVMQVTQDHRILRRLANDSGHALIKLPRRLQRFGPATLAAVQVELHKVVTALLNYNAGSAGVAETDKALMETIEKLLFVRKQIRSGSDLPLEKAQRELPLG